MIFLFPFQVPNSDDLKTKMFLSNKFTHNIPSSVFYGATFFENFIAYSSQEEGLVVRNLNTNQKYYQQVAPKSTLFQHVELTKNYLIYLHDQKIHIHHYHSNTECFDNKIKTISIPFQYSFCENVSPYISNLSVHDNYLAYCIDFQYRVLFKIIDLETLTEVYNFEIQKIAQFDFHYDVMERPLIKIYGEQVLCSTGTSICYLYDIKNKRKIRMYDFENDIIRLFFDNDLIGAITEVEHGCFQITHINRQDDFGCTITKNIDSISDFYSIFMFRDFIVYKDKNCQLKCLYTKNNKEFLLVRNLKETKNTVISFYNDTMLLFDKGTIMIFDILKKKDVILPLFKGSIQNVFGTVHENIDVKRYIFEYLY